MSDEKSGPGVSSLARNVMLDAWSKADTVLGGTETMRQAGTRFLPKHKGEEDDRYSERRDTAVLWNQSELTLNNWVGRPFAKPIVLSEDMPDVIKDLSANMDLQGTDMHVMAQEWFRIGLAKSFAHVLVDMPRRGDNHVTLNDDAASGARPYWNLIEPERIIGARSVVVDGVEVMSHLRIFEHSVEATGPYTEQLVERIREYNLVPEGTLDENDQPMDAHVAVAVWRRVDEDEDFEDEKAWAVEEQFDMEIDVIPLVTFYSDRQGFLLGKAPLMDLYDMNIQHWQSDSDQNAVLTIARFPILAMSGVDEEEGSSDATGGGDTVVIGPFNVLRVPESTGRIYYVEHSGKAIAAGRESLLELRDRMSSYGAAFLKKAPGRQTATARALDSAESLSPLQAMAIKFQSAMQQALEYTAKWLSLDDGGSVEVVTDFGPSPGDKSDIAALTDANTRGNLSRKALLSEYKRRGILNEKYDADEDAIQIKAEKDEFQQENTEPEGSEQERAIESPSPEDG